RACLRILSIRQPWAYLIANGDKDIENRSWRTKYRGLFLIHASLALDRDGCRAQKLLAEDMETGGGVGMAEIVDCVTYHPSKWFRGHYGIVFLAYKWGHLKRLNVSGSYSDR